jgi:anti-sigma B factor antagonist
VSEETPLSVERLPREDGVVVLALSGELVVTNRESLRERAEAELESGARKIVIAIGGLSHVDTSGLALLVQLANRCAERGGRLAVAGLVPGAEEMRQSLFLDEAVVFADGVEDAVAALAG